ncbi:MAG: hypothetical protein JST01_13760 [Cyanobacteria bacterium SZAS TMP-1]|nr:hypothetical protein [Cyanobacteria bacterium SZAS TMP-1]
MVDEKPMRKIILVGGDYTGRRGEAAQDYVYIVESVAPLERDPSCASSKNCDESINLLGDYRRAKKFNATGRFEAINEEDFEVYEFAGTEDHSIFIETQV